MLTGCERIFPLWHLEPCQMKHYLIFELEIPLIWGVGIPHLRDPIPHIGYPIPHMSVTYPSFKGYQLVVCLLCTDAKASFSICSCEAHRRFLIWHFNSFHAFSPPGLKSWLSKTNKICSHALANFFSIWFWRIHSSWMSDEVEALIVTGKYISAHFKDSSSTKRTEGPLNLPQINRHIFINCL